MKDKGKSQGRNIIMTQLNYVAQKEIFGTFLQILKVMQS